MFRSAAFANAFDAPPWSWLALADPDAKAHEKDTLAAALNAAVLSVTLLCPLASLEVEQYNRPPNWTRLA
jgi:hypothetical protein